jgi:hypothetical protein
VPLNGNATLNAERKLGVAEPPDQAKQKDDQLLEKSNQLIQKTQHDVGIPPSNGAAAR